jgi:hypothetical protein
MLESYHAPKMGASVNEDANAFWSSEYGDNWTSLRSRRECGHEFKAP